MTSAPNQSAPSTPPLMDLYTARDEHALGRMYHLLQASRMSITSIRCPVTTATFSPAGSITPRSHLLREEGTLKLDRACPVRAPSRTTRPSHSTSNELPSGE